MELDIKAIQSLLKKNKHRKILHCLNYTQEAIVFTNSYSLVKLNQKNNVEKEINVNVFNGEINNDTYPNIADIAKREGVEKVESITIESKDGYTFYYKINGMEDIKYDKNLVDKTFKCIKKSPFFSHNVISNKDKLFLTKEKGLVYQKDNLYIYILGIRMN